MSLLRFFAGQVVKMPQMECLGIFGLRLAVSSLNFFFVFMSNPIVPFLRVSIFRLDFCVMQCGILQNCGNCGMLRVRKRKTAGFFGGSYQTKLETAKAMKGMNYPVG